MTLFILFKKTAMLTADDKVGFVTYFYRLLVHA
jgi:hypothetical protein